MGNSEERDRKHNPPYIDPALIIDTRLREVERQQSEDKRQQQEYNRKQLKFNGLLVLFTALLFLTSIGSDFLMLRYVSLTKQSADAATSAAATASTAQSQMKAGADETKLQVDRIIAQEQRQADAAKSAVISSENTLKLNQRAYIVFQAADLIPTGGAGPDEKMSLMIEPLKEWLPNIAFTARIGIKNVGKSPARNRKGFAVLNISEIPTRESLREAAEKAYALVRKLMPALLDVSQDMAPDQTAYLMGVPPKILNIKGVSRMKRDEIGIVVAGIILYQDIFGISHNTEYCVIYSGKEPGSYALCGVHNTIR